MARGEQITRHWNLLKTLQTRGIGLTLQELCAEFEVSDRTLQRDFETLQALGFPIRHEADEHGKRFWSLPPDFLKAAPLTLGVIEALSLHLAQRLFTPLAGTHLADGLQSILDKIRSLLPKAALDYFADLDETLHVHRLGATDYAAHAETLRTLHDAARSERTVEIDYYAHSRGARYTTLYDPYGLVFYDGDFYLIGRSHRANAIRMFKVVRVAAARRTADAFARSADFHLADHFRDGFGIMRPSGEPIEIVVRFYGAAVALLQERLWHESQRLEELTDAETTPDAAGAESARATFRLANPVEFKRWLKGFGDLAEVLEPDWLRAEMQAELRAAARRYEK